MRLDPAEFAEEQLRRVQAQLPKLPEGRVIRREVIPSAIACKPPTRRAIRARAARAAVPRSPRFGGPPARENLWANCLWPYTQFSTPAGQRPPGVFGVTFVKFQPDLPSRWPPHGCGGEEEPDLQNAGGTLFEARRNPAFFPRATSPYSARAREQARNEQPRTALADLIAQNGRGAPPLPVLPPAPPGTRPKPGQSIAPPVGSPPVEEIAPLGICDDPEELVISCLWPFSMLNIEKARKEGPEFIRWVRLRKGEPQTWPPRGCNFGVQPVATWWILDFIRGLLGIQNPPLKLFPGAGARAPVPVVTSPQPGTPVIVPLEAPPLEPAPGAGAGCGYTWRTGGTFAATSGLPFADPDGRVISNQADYVASPWILLGASGPAECLVVTNTLRSK